MTAHEWTAHIAVDMTNDAFQHDPNGELAAILETTAGRLRREGLFAAPLRDINGNTVGRLHITGKQPQP